jgi:hypothetical protein
MRMVKGQPFIDVEADGEDVPVFSESFLYNAVDKGDARFILGVAEEYNHVIQALGVKGVKAILGVKPRLVQRLGTGEKVAEWLEDARDEQELWREKQNPSEVVLDSDAAHELWELLHNEYRRAYNPEKSMDKDTLRAYNTLTEALGEWEIKERQKERDRLPEKLERQKRAKKRVEKEREHRQKKKKADAAVKKAKQKKGSMKAAIDLVAACLKLEEEIEDLRWAHLR